MSGAAGIDAATVGLVVGLAGVVFAVAILAAVVLSRRKLRREARELVSALEGMRGGRARQRPDVPEESPLGMVADSVQRLGQDLAARWSEAARTAMQLDALHAAAPDTAVVATDPEGVVRSFNEAAETLFACPAEAIVGQPASVLFPEESWKDLLPKLLRRDAIARGIRMRARLERHGGEPFEADLFVRPLRREGGEPGAGFLAAIRDIDERVALERRLERMQARHRAFLDRLGDGVLVVRDGRVASANAAAAALLARDADDLVGTPVHALVATRDVLRVREWVAAATDVDGADPGRLQVAATAGGANVAVGLRAVPIDDDGAPALLVVLEDETAGRRLEVEVRRNEERLDAVLEATSDGILVLTDVGGSTGAVVHLVNRPFAALLGLEPRAVLGATESTLIRRLRERGGGAEQVAALLAAAGEDTVRDTVRVGDGAPREVDVTCTRLRGRTGEPVGRLLACRDRTDVRALERRLESRAEDLREGMDELLASHRRLEGLNAELHRRAVDLDRLNHELRRLDEMKTQLLANVSHDLQMPLVSIRGFTEMIAKERLGPVTEEQRRGLGVALKNIDRLISMIDGLLEYSRMEREIGELELSEFPVTDLLDEVEATLAPQVAERGLTWSSTVVDPVPVIHGDRAKLAQVVLNLAGNAVKYNVDGGRVDIEVTRKDDAFAEVAVRDTGPGISRDDLDRIFDRFYRAEDGAKRAEGTGLGLAIVRNLLRLHGCSIRADSTPGEGATFTFTLPLAERNGGRADGHGEDHADADARDPGPDDPSRRARRADRPPADPGQRHGADGGDGGDDDDARTDDDRGREPERPRLRIIRP